MGAQEARTGTVRMRVTVILETVLKKRRGEHDAWNVRYVLEGTLWVSVRVFLLSDNVLHMRTTAVKWDIAGCMAPSLSYTFSS